MAKKIIEVEVQTNIPGTINELKALKKELKNAAAGSDEFKRLYNEIDDLEEKISSTKKTSADWVDSIAAAPGPLGMLGKAINSVKEGTVSFGGALKATGIGLIVALLGGLYKAFSDNEGAMKKIKPLLEGIERIFQGVYRVVEPLLDIFIDLAIKALPMVTKAFGMMYSIITAASLSLRDFGTEFASFIKKVKEGGLAKEWEDEITRFNVATNKLLNLPQLPGQEARVKKLEEGKKSIKSFTDYYNESMKRFNDGTKEQTKSENEAAEEKKKKEAEAAEARRKAAEIRKNKEKEDAIKHAEDLKNIEHDLQNEVLELNAKTEQEKLDLQAKLELEEILKQVKKGDDITKIMELYNEKYIKLDADLQEKLAKQAAETKDKTKRQLEEYNLGVKDYKDAKNQEELDQARDHQQRLLDYAEQDALAEVTNKEDRQVIMDYYNQKEYDNLKAWADAGVALDKDTADKKMAVEDAYKAAKRKALDTGLEILMQFAGKNKAVALTILAVQKGLAIADVVVGAAKAISAATSALAMVPAVIGVVPNPMYAVQAAATAKGILTTKISAATSIASILAAGIASAGSITAGGTDTSSTGGTAAAAAPAPPNYNVVGASPTNLLTAQAMAENNNKTPIKAYVVANDVSTAQALNRNIVTSASIG